MITLIGVGHVFAISDQVTQLIRSKGPDVVCIELDRARYQSLRSGSRSGRVPLQYSLMAMFQKKMADRFGAEVGAEMLAAAEAAREINAKIAFVDVDASAMLTVLWKKMTMRERIKLLAGALIGLVSSKETVEREMEAYQNNDEGYLKSVEEQFPVLKKVLIDDRNRIMAERISEVAETHTNVVAVVGDGHVPGIATALARQDLEVVRLKQLMGGTSMTFDEPSEHSTTFYLNEDNSWQR
ncbi:MAG: TraB/GumN family protein [Methanobacteriota archaeon]|nr:MAG: TraB/GumN family protein [Euryarchaeota archaeon]